MLALFNHPDQRRRLHHNLDGLLPTAVEEMLRYVSPVIYMRRTAMRDIELGGKKIQAGDKVAMYYGSANRDESMFPDPDKFDVGRTPNEHIAFGGGEHFCLGSHIARVEIQVMLREIMTRLPDIKPVGSGGVPRVELYLRPAEDAGPIHGEKSLVRRGGADSAMSACRRSISTGFTR